MTYRHYATLYFILISTSTESPLALLDLIQVFVESLDRLFENVCELDLIFNFETLHAVLGEMIVGGVVIETGLDRYVFPSPPSLSFCDSCASTIGLADFVLQGCRGSQGSGQGS